MFGPGCSWERKGKRLAGTPHAAAANRKHITVGPGVARKPIATALCKLDHFMAARCSGNRATVGKGTELDRAEKTPRMQETPAFAL